MLRETRFYAMQGILLCYFIRKRDFRMLVRTYTKQMLVTKPCTAGKERNTEKSSLYTNKTTGTARSFKTRGLQLPQQI